MLWRGGNRSEKKTGSAAGDQMYGMGGNDTIYGGAGNDMIDGNAGNDRVYGGKGNDDIPILGADQLYGGTEKDFFALLGIMYNLRLGASNRAVIHDFNTKGVAAQTDVLELSGFKFKWADRDADFTDGFSMTKSGSDVLIRTRDTGGNLQEVLLKNVALSALNTNNIKLIPGLAFAPDPPAAPGDPVIGTSGPDRMVGTAKADFLIGEAGNDTLIGYGGDDTLNGGKGADLMSGGKGADRMYVSGGDTATGGAGADTFVFLSRADFTTITNAGRGVIKDFTATGAAHDRIDLFAFDITHAQRDLGLEDGYELRSVKGGVLMSIVDSDDKVISLLLEGVNRADLDASDFIFAI